MFFWVGTALATHLSTWSAIVYSTPISSCSLMTLGTPAHSMLAEDQTFRVAGSLLLSSDHHGRAWVSRQEPLQRYLNCGSVLWFKVRGRPSQWPRFWVFGFGQCCRGCFLEAVFGRVGLEGLIYFWVQRCHCPWRPYVFECERFSLNLNLFNEAE